MVPTANTAPTVDPDIPRSAKDCGFRIVPKGTHLSRTIMLEDLRMILAACPVSAGVNDYRAAIIDENILGKPTASARRIAFDRLRDLYAFDPRILLFRALRDLWDIDREAQRMLALLSSTARDPILRAMTPYLLSLPIGSEVSPKMLSDEAERHFPSKFRTSTLEGLGRNAASSWEQAGLLRGRKGKQRARGESHAASVTYALLLGDLCGRRGRALFETLWMRVLDTPVHVLRELAVMASYQGWIDYRCAGDVIEVSFRHLMRDDLRIGV